VVNSIASRSTIKGTALPLIQIKPIYLSNSGAFDSIVYVWGYNGYCRLGLGNQQDVLTPKVVPQVSAIFLFMSILLFADFLAF